ncbi:MAG TPA: MoaD family protein [Halanaerobiales bacterium]|nr:MoaD family protein [Halanaerobiales bacterium]
MQIEVKFYSLFKINLKSSGVKYDIVETITLLELIDKLDKDFEGYFSEKLLEDGDIKTGSIILLNGINVLHINHLETEINDGDIVTLFPPSAGG